MENISQFFIAKHNTYQQIFVLGTPGGTTIKIFEQSTGINVSNFRHQIDNSALGHVKKNHPNITASDFRKIPKILKTPDGITYEGKSKQGLETIKYKKTFNQTTYYYIEEARTGKRVLSLKTIYKLKTPSGAPLE